MENKNKNKNKGFTLIELMVAIFVFTAIMLVAMGSLLSTIATVKEARILRFTMDNVNFATESMTRTIRMGTNYYCSQGEDVSLDPSNGDTVSDCAGGGTLIAFVPQESDPAGSRVAYKQLTNGDGSLTIERCDYKGGCVPILSPEVKIKKLRFYVNGSSFSDGEQASVYIVIKGEVMSKGVPISFSLQTMASQRNY